MLATVRKAGAWVSRIPAHGSKVDRRQHKMLHELEETLGQTLFDRTGRALQLNAAGQRAMLSFRGMRGTLEQLHRELHELQLGSAGRLSIGSIMAASPTFLTRALAKLKEQY